MNVSPSEARSSQDIPAVTLTIAAVLGRPSGGGAMARGVSGAATAVLGAPSVQASMVVSPATQARPGRPVAAYAMPQVVAVFANGF